MKNVYDRLEGLATEITKNPDESILVISDYGMKVRAYLLEERYAIMFEYY